MTGRAATVAIAAAALLLVVLASAASASDTVAVYLTSGHARLARQREVHFSRGSGGAAVTIDVDPAQRLQAINGFGAAFTDSSLWLLSRLRPATRTALLRRLLDRRHGIGLSVMRVPIGASDFTASGLYSYDDVPAGASDPTLAHFSIAHDRSYVLPILREALHIDPALRIVANPWSPPAWMKTNDSMVEVTSGGVGRLRPDAYAPLAQYFVRFLEAYRAAGVRVWAVTPQNEPLQPTVDYAGMQMSPQEEATFVHGYLAPALRAAGLDVRIYGYDYTWAGAEPYVGALLAPGVGAAADIAGIAYHCYFGAPESMATLHTLFPTKDAFEDECSTGISLLSPIQVIVRSVDNWASGALMWNVALDPSGGPKIGSGCVSCIGVVTIDPATGRVAYGGDFYELGQLSEFVARGATRIAASASGNTSSCADAPVCGLEYAAFHDPDGREVVVVTNSGTSAASFAVRRPDGASFSYSLPGQSPPNGTDNSRDGAVVTFVWGGRAAASKPHHRRHRSAPHGRRRRPRFTA